MNLLDNPVSRLLESVSEPKDSPEAIAAQEKSERIAYHRLHVRNGPVKMSSPTSGQIRRAQRRAQAKRTKKRHQSAVRDHLAAKLEHGVLRGQLQAVGVLPYANGGYLPASKDHIVTTCGQALVAKFGRIDDEGRVDIEAAYLGALNRLMKLSGEQPVVSLEEYEAVRLQRMERARREAETDAFLDERFERENA